MSVILRCVVIKPQEVAVAVGHELKPAGLDLKWTREPAADRAVISISTLDHNETGTRMCTLVTLAQLCRSMAVPAPDLLARAMQRMTVDLDQITLHIDQLDNTPAPILPGRALRRLDMPPNAGCISGGPGTASTARDSGLGGGCSPNLASSDQP